MTKVQLTAFDVKVRGELTRAIAELGHAPGNGELGQRVGGSVDAVEESLRRLHGAHSLQLHPHRCVPWVVHPFALSPGSCWVQLADRGWWANCLYCGMGIAAALEEDTSIYTRIGGEREALVVQIRSGEVLQPDLLFHLSIPVREWWDNVIHACATFQPFHSEMEIDDWCRRHALPRGAVVPMPKMWRFAADWYGDYLRQPWRQRSKDEIATLFSRHGFSGQFWQLD